MLGAKTKIQKILSFASALGTVLSLLGLFLPWGALTSPPGWMVRIPDQVLGFEVLIGDLALAGCLLSLSALVLNFSRPNRFIKFAFAGETCVVLFSLLWIVDSHNLSLIWVRDLGLIFLGNAYWTLMYGAYVSLMGSLITLSAISIDLVAFGREIT